MNVKKTLESRIRGWFPQEPVLKAPLKAQIAPINRSSSFKVRRWLHGTSAFISSLLGQISLITKILVLAFGIGIFTIGFLYFLTINNLISGFVNLWVGRIVDVSVLLLVVVYYSYDYFKNKLSHKNHLSESINPNLKLWGNIATIIGLLMGLSAIILINFFDYFLDSNGVLLVPFYFGLGAFFVILFGFWLSMEWRKRNKLSPF